jgi:[ribosomal protein S5]-alanine N-acetyltransferase
MCSSTGELCGARGLIINSRDANAELGYWIGATYWEQGYPPRPPERSCAIGSKNCGSTTSTPRISGRNPACSRVFTKIVLSYEGTRREHHRKYGDYEHWVKYGLIVGEWRA